MAWTHNNWRNASFNPHKKDDRLLASTVTAVRQHKIAKPVQEEQRKEDVSLDLVEVLNRPPAARVKWLQKGLFFVATKGKSQITALYDIVLHRKFVSDISVELAKQMLEMLNLNLHLFSVKQKQVLEVKLNMLGEFLDTVGDEESSETEEDLAPSEPGSRSQSPSREESGNDNAVGQVHQASAPEADSASNAKCVANAAAAAAFASAAKVMAAAAQEAAAAAKAAPPVAPSSLPAAPTTQDAFPSQSKASRSRSASVHGKEPHREKEKEKEKKRKRSRSGDASMEKKRKRKKSRSRSKKKRSRSKKKSRSRSRKRSRSRSKKKSRSRSKRKSRSRSKKKKSRSRSRKRSGSRSKAKRRAKSSSSSSISQSRIESRNHRSSPRRGPVDSSIWLPPPMSAKEAVASGGKDDEMALRAQGMSISGAQADARRISEKPAAGTNPQLRPGDWFCPLCGAHNYSSKSHCFRCVKAPPSNPSSVPSASAQQNLAFSAPLQLPSGGPMSAGDNLRQAQLNAARRLAAVPSPAAPVRSGDWFCSVCNAHNFASKSKCFRCMQGKNPRMAGGMM